MSLIVHEIPHEVGDFAILLKAGFSRWDAACAQLYTAFAGILGALTALMFSASSDAVGELKYYKFKDKKLKVREMRKVSSLGNREDFLNRKFETVMHDRTTPVLG